MTRYDRNLPNALWERMSYAVYTNYLYTGGLPATAQGYLAFLTQIESVPQMNLILLTTYVPFL